MLLAAALTVCALLAATGGRAPQGHAAGAVAAAARNCGTVKIAGKKWQVVSAAVTCPHARALIRKLAPVKPRARTSVEGVRRYTGIHQGMKCIRLSGHGRTVVQCLGAKAKSGKIVIGQTRG